MNKTEVENAMSRRSANITLCRCTASDCRLARLGRSIWIISIA